MPVLAAARRASQSGSRVRNTRVDTGALLSELKDTPDNVNTFAVTQVLVHPDHDAETLDFDVALLRLGARAHVPSVPIACAHRRQG